ncbi:MAG: DNA polymerase III subunit gamma/tau, partial [Acidobacteria bacterium]|nr:DNA polymerase III subunit gamma/tau [Acidobacteriota bacterium]
KALNCEKGPAAEPCNECSICREITEGIDLDVREIDAATYSKAEDVREIREVLQFQPARDRYRIFIIDEVHSLSGQAWNALLKQIEEPPPHVIFMMATTEMHKVPATILSRVQQFALKKITHDELLARLEQICEAEEIDADRAALDLIVRRGEGSVRDSLSLLDQIIAFSGRELRGEAVSAVLGLSGSSFFARVMTAIAEGSPATVLELVEEASESGRDFKLLYRDLLGYARNLLLVAGGAPDRMLLVPPDDLAPLRESAAAFDYTEILRLTNLLIRDDEIVSRSEQQRLAVELALLKAATLPRLRSIEDALASSGSPAPSQPRKPAPQARPAPAGKTTAPRASAIPAPASGGGDDVDRIMNAVASQRRASAQYLRSAKAIRIEEDVLRIEFDKEDQFAADYVSEPALSQFIAAQASETLGRAISVKVVIVSAAAPAGEQAKKSSPLNDDPVLNAFKKHLGGEVVSRGPAGRNSEER